MRTATVQKDSMVSCRSVLPVSEALSDCGWQANPPAVRAGYSTRPLQFPPE
jgi:hypothetical protein